jgi:hypothetical protein
MPKQVSAPRLPEFRLTPEQIQVALNHPIRSKVRRELVLPDEKGTKGNAWNRIVAKGMVEFQDQTGMPIATLIRQLLVLYFTGNLHRSDGYQIAATYDFEDDAEAPGTADEVIDTDFEFPSKRMDDE